MMSQVQNPANQRITKISFCRADNRFVDIITRFLIYTGIFFLSIYINLATYATALGVFLSEAWSIY